MKRFLNLKPSEMVNLTKDELLNSIKASEGRIIMTESIVLKTPSDGITGAEVARAFGGDLILLNMLDVFNPSIVGIDDEENPVHRLKELVSRPVGVNLEPVDLNAESMETIHKISEGRIATKESLIRASEIGLDFVCFTGNPGTGVTNRKIIDAIKLAKKYFKGAIIAGKMHSSGIDEKIVSIETTREFLDSGADIILLPALYTVPGTKEEELRECVEMIHKEGKLALSTIGTSQESSSRDVIRNIALSSKAIGFDIQHIGDSGYGGISNPENILEMSEAIRGVRHTISMIARSIRR